MTSRLLVDKIEGKATSGTINIPNHIINVTQAVKTDTQTATFTPSILFYDVLLTEPSGSKNYYLEGKLFISEGYTA